MANTRSDSPQGNTRLTSSVAAFEHLTGMSRGTVDWVYQDHVGIFLNQGRLSLRPADADWERNGQALAIAELRRSDPYYELLVVPGQSLWVNRRLTTQRLLVHGDVIEFGETGPISRFRRYDSTHGPQWTIDEIVGDCLAYVRTSRRPLLSRLTCAVRDMIRRVVHETSLIFRLVVLVALISLTAVSYRQWTLSEDLKRALSESAEELEGVASALARSRAEALRPGDLRLLREQIGGDVSANIERLDALERRSTAGVQVVADAQQAVAFIQGAYGLKDKDSGRSLRQVVGKDGIPLTTPTGQPMLSFDGKGPIAEIRFTGTGFVLDGGWLITNRHVAEPWTNDTNSRAMAARGHEAVLLKLVAYLPGQPTSASLTLVSASDEVDLAVLDLKDPSAPQSFLQLSRLPPRAGEEIILMGYPTGLRSILAQAGRSLINKLKAGGELDFWNVSEQLAAEQLILPLASRGIIGKVGENAIVYDAETTHGGSGGPVLNLRGEVVAVNMAILPEFGGSNLGVPATEVAALLEKARRSRAAITNSRL